MQGAPARRHNGVLVAALLLACAIGCAACTGSTTTPVPTPTGAEGRTASLTPGVSDWTTFGRDDARTGGTFAIAGRVSPNLERGRSVALDGPVYGQPLIV